MKRIFLALLLILTTGSAVFGLTNAFFSDSELSNSNSVEGGELDLLIDNTSYLNGVLNQDTTWQQDNLPGHLFFNFNDIKPGDIGEDTISIHVADNDAWACAEITLTKDDDNTCTEPELLDDPTCNEPDGDLLDGELGGAVNMVFWVDDGDNVLEVNEATPGGILAQGQAKTVLNGTKFILADSTKNIFQGSGPLIGGATNYIGKAWCFGTLTLAPLTQDGFGDVLSPANSTGGVTCNGTGLNNATQTDSVMADLSFTAIQSRNNPGFRCDGATPTPSPTPTPTPPLISCETNDIQFASSSSDNDQGLRKDSTAVLANRSIASAAFGAPQTSGADSDVGFPVGSFFSLGFPLGGNTASIVYGFASPFYPNPSGPDLQIFEVTGGVYPDEAVKVEASSTAVGPWTVLSAAAVRDESIELGILPSAQFVRLTDVSNIALFPTDADGYDLDALKTFCKAAI